MNGFSFVVCAGKYGGFYAKRESMSWRICFGWVAFTVWFCDIEDLTYKALKNKDLLS